jgi:hypothetical protein
MAAMADEERRRRTLTPLNSELRAPESTVDPPLAQEDEPKPKKRLGPSGIASIDKS